MKEGKTKLNGNIIQCAVCTNIQNLVNLTMEELKDGLRYCRLQKAELQQQAKRLRKVHLCDCHINAQTNKRHEFVRDIKQTIQQEESKWMWYLIKFTIKDPHSPSMLKVQRVLDGETKESIIQVDVSTPLFAMP
jgi:hypothetical protein